LKLLATPCAYEVAALVLDALRRDEIGPGEFQRVKLHQALQNS
jgi:hypothetical protein